MITQQNFHDGNLREAAKVARNDYAVPAKTTMTGARAEMGRKPLDQVLSLSFEKHEVVLQFDMHSQFHQLKSPCKHALCRVGKPYISTEAHALFAKLHVETLLPKDESCPLWLV